MQKVAFEFITKQLITKVNLSKKKMFELKDHLKMR